MKTVKSLDIAYGSVNKAVLMNVPKNARNILDVGCGSGDLGSAIKQKCACTVTGLTYNPIEARLAAGKLDHVVLLDLNSYPLDISGEYDCIICSHVLEHLYKPHLLLHELQSKYLTQGGLLIVALPNILHWKQRIAFMLGHFRYTKGGVMDETHYRFFDWNTATELVESAGLPISSRYADGIFPLARFLGPCRSAINRAACQFLPGLFGWQFIIVARAGKLD